MLRSRLSVPSRYGATCLCRRMMSATVSGLQTPPASASATSSAQPLSTPATPSPSRSDASVVASTKGGISKAKAAAVGREATQRQPSSMSPGTVMKGLNISKAGQDPIALKDEDYPGWLFDLVNPVAKNIASANTAAAVAGEPQGAGLGIDIAEKKEMRRRNREAIKRRNFFAGRL